MNRTLVFDFCVVTIDLHNVTFINCQAPVTAQSGCFPDAGETSIVTSGDSFPQLGNPPTADYGRTEEVSMPFRFDLTTHPPGAQ